jgi:hypothetical protein
MKRGKMKIELYFVSTPEFFRQSPITKEKSQNNGAEDPKLSARIAVRKEEGGNCFIYNIRDNMIFFADQEAFDYVSGLLDSRLHEVKKELLEELHVYG